MPLYRVVFEGRNFLAFREGVVKRYRFVTTRFVDAPSKPAAERMVVDQLRSDSELTGCVRNSPQDSPQLAALAVDPVESRPEDHVGALEWHEENA